MHIYSHTDESGISMERHSTEQNGGQDIAWVIISIARCIVSGWDASLIVCYMQQMRIDMADCLVIYKAINLMSLSQANATSLTGVVTHTQNTHADSARVGTIIRPSQKSRKL